MRGGLKLVNKLLDLLDERWVELVSKIDTLMKKGGLKQIVAADLFGVSQPDISKMLRAEFRQFSVERLLRFLIALDQDLPGLRYCRQAAP